MQDLFKAHLNKFIMITDTEFEAISSFFTIISVKKKQNLLTEGAICRSHYFVLQGCLRKFFINEKGVEQTTEFAIENWWVTDHISYEHRRPSEFFIQAVEPAHLLMITKDKQDELLQAHPTMERYFRFIYQRAYAAAQMRTKYIFGLSKEAFYHHLNNHYPEFVQRIPQYLIASYLGFTPEYLSEIRAKKNS
ncbi:Crp/Fnr family transcriptional regulator [Niabella insulamsoli]|uniref:Crp/Fnr family transcriptional regulator n=1 Tax=Niabella insulamsoli TaxID=3144874 RepID=UPI0031FC553C